MTEPEAAVAILHARAPHESVLLIRRAEREGDSWSGQWSFPGGRRDLEDSDLVHTALRELEEECGIRLDRDRLAAALPRTTARRKAGPFLQVAPYLFHVGEPLAVALDAREAAEARWVPLRVLRDPERHTLAAVPGRPKELLFPAIDLDGVPLWGFTYRLITAWLALDPPAPLHQAGFNAARAVLEYLVSHGLTLEEDWRDCAEANEARKAVLVKGPGIPVERVLAHFSRPGGHVAAINCLEVRSDCVRVVGLEFEDYLIRTAHSSPPGSSPAAYSR